MERRERLCCRVGRPAHSLHSAWQRQPVSRPGAVCPAPPRPCIRRAQIASDAELSLAAARLLAAEADKPGLAARRVGSEPSPARWAARKLALLLQLEGLPGAGDSVNARLLAAGLARVAPPRGRAVRRLPCALSGRAAPGRLRSGLPMHARRASGGPELSHT